MEKNVRENRRGNQNGQSRETGNIGTTRQDILQPLHDCTKADGQIKSSLLELMICYGDVVAMSQIVSTVYY
jgi:hypothetical protein